MEKAPTVIKAGLKKEEAEELKKKLEAGAQLLLLIADPSQALMPIPCVQSQHASCCMITCKQAIQEFPSYTSCALMPPVCDILSRVRTAEG